MRQSTTSACLVLVALAAPAAAQETSLAAYLGVAATTNYVFRGNTQTDDRPALQPYAELEASGVGPGALYAGIWASNVDFGEFEIETDFYGGYRGETGALAYDLGYVRYVYTDSGDCCGEGFVNLGASPLEMLTVAAGYYRDFDLETDYVTGGAEVALPYEFGLSGAVGTYADDGPTDWNVGIFRPLTETMTADLRYHDSDAGDWIVNATFSFDTDWSSLLGR